MGTSITRVALVATPRSSHTRNWVRVLAQAGVEVHLVTLEGCSASFDSPLVQVHEVLDGEPPRGLPAYLRTAPALAKELKRIRPQLVNSHYASNYGAVAAVAARWAGLPHLLSVWGSDVYEFPERSRAHRLLMNGVLRLPQVIGSTSRAMARRTREFTHRPIAVTPFGIDVEGFAAVDRSGRDEPVVVGTVKTLDHRYGIDVLLDAFALVDAERPGRARLSITGDGVAHDLVHEHARRLGLEDCLHPAVGHEQVPARLAELDIFVALSREESFGVAILEAAATGLPVVVSDAPGPAEVTVDGQTGLVVPREDARAAADAIIRLIDDPQLRESMGTSGRQHVVDHYSTAAAVADMLAAYELATRGR